MLSKLKCLIDMVDYGAPRYITARMNPDKDCIYHKLNQIETITVVAVEAASL